MDIQKLVYFLNQCITQNGSRLSPSLLHQIGNNTFILTLNNKNCDVIINDEISEPPVITIMIEDKLLTEDLFGLNYGISKLENLTYDEVIYIGSILKNSENFWVTVNRADMYNRFKKGRSNSNKEYKYNIGLSGQVPLNKFSSRMFSDLLEINQEHYCGCHINFINGEMFYSLAQELIFLNPNYGSGHKITATHKKTIVNDFILSCYDFPIKISNLNDYQQKQLKEQCKNFTAWGITIVEDVHKSDPKKNIYTIDTVHKYGLNEEARKARLTKVVDIVTKSIINITEKSIAGYIATNILK